MCVIVEVFCSVGFIVVMYILVIGVDVDSLLVYVWFKVEGEVGVLEIFLDSVILWLFIVFGLEDNFFN